MCGSALDWMLIICLGMVVVRIQGLSQLIETQQVVTVTLGGDAHFSCRLMEPKDVLQVTWRKETPGGTVNVASYNKRFGEKFNEPFQKKVEFLHTGLNNCSIIIRGVSRADESCYKCLFHIYPDEAISGRTCLQVNELYGPTLLVTQTNYTHHLISELTLSCSATGRPAPIVAWDDTVRSALENSTMVNVTHPNGTVTVTITSTVSVPRLPDNVTVFKCFALSDYVIREGFVNVPTSLTGPTLPPVTDGWIRGHGTLMGSVGLFALICIITWWLHKRNQKNRNETGKQNVDESRDVFELQDSSNVAVE